MDLETFHKLIFPVKSKLFRFAYRYLGDEEDARDLVQEVFLKVWKGTDEVNNWEAWCMRITRNLALDKLRSKKRSLTSSFEDGFDVPQGGKNVLEKTELMESMKHVAHFIQALPEKQRNVIHLRDIEGYSYQEIASVLEMELGQVKINLFRARKAVREKLLKINAYEQGAN